MYITIPGTAYLQLLAGSVVVVVLQQYTRVLREEQYMLPQE
jgi:hypothetical protein